MLLHNKCTYYACNSSVQVNTSNICLHICLLAKNEEERLNPENGICLSSLYENYEILLSSEIKKKSKEEYQSKYFAPLSGMKIILPTKDNPKMEFLQYI